jgi:hypothetical protein
MKRVLTIPVFALAFPLAVLVAGQTASPGWKGTVAIEDGVKVIKNLGQPLYGEFAFDLLEELSIGGDPLKEDHYFPRGASLSIDPAGNLYVVDRGNRRVMMYDPAGKLVRQIGRQGQGPGEYSYPSAVFVDPVGNPIVWASREMVCYDREGVFAKKVLIKGFLSRAILGPRGTIIGSAQPGPGPEGPKHKLLQVGAAGEPLRTVAEYRGEFKESQTAIVLHHYNNNLDFAPLTAETFVYGFSGEYRLNVADAEGETVLVLTKDEKPRPISGREKDETRKSGIWATIGTNDRTLRDGDFPDHRPFFSRIFTDDVGHIYVARTKSILEKDPSWEIDVFSKEGFYIYRMSWRAFPSAIQWGFFYEVRSDEESGEYFVVRSRIKNWTSMKNG